MEKTQFEQSDIITFHNYDAGWFCSQWLAVEGQRVKLSAGRLRFSLFCLLVCETND
jgi:hypothetical protein